MWNKISIFLVNNMVSLVLFVFIVVMAFIKPSFRTWDNVTNIINEFSVYGITACAMTIAIICAEFDLSASSVFAWSTVLFVICINAIGIAPAFLATLAVGALMGALNGILVARVRMPAFVVTLGTMTAIKGLAYVATNAQPINTDNQILYFIGKINIAGLTVSPMVFLIVLILFILLMKYTRFGRNIYAAGGNYEVAMLSGINVRFCKFIIFVLLGACAALSGMVYCSRIMAGWAPYGSDLSLYCVTAVVIGGTSLVGGTGGVARTVSGLLVLGVLFNALTLLGVDGSMQRFMRGLVLIVIIMVDAAVNRSRKI
ncbi:MAG: ABC transporter permease [Treponema sp.]|jgi:ribose transport system permease protein|nr:ABC transporter permease [Treponema sp.]